VEAARETVARLAVCDPRDVILTSGGTEANNLAVRSAFDGGTGVFVTSRVEHPSITRVGEAIEREGRARVRWLRVEADGTIDLADLAGAIGEGGVRLVAVQAVNSETGVVQPLSAVRELTARAGVRLHVDAIQAFGRVDVTASDADTRSLAAHKMRGPKSIGALISRPGLSLVPVLRGGSQERGLRPGTTDPVAAAGLRAAALHALSSPPRWAVIGSLRDRFEQRLLELVPGARVNGASALRAPHVTSVAFPGWGGPELVAALDLEGVSVSSGSACSAGTAEPSAVLVAMGDADAARRSVRFSLGEDTTPDDLEFALAAVRRVIGRGAS
jgi:cysteine desulfurase